MLRESMEAQVAKGSKHLRKIKFALQKSVPDNLADSIMKGSKRSQCPGWPKLSMSTGTKKIHFSEI